MVMGIYKSKLVVKMLIVCSSNGHAVWLYCRMKVYIERCSLGQLLCNGRIVTAHSQRWHYHLLFFNNL